MWELYDTNKDWSQAHDLSKEMPDKLHELQRLWLIEATRNNVLPMDDRTAERFNSDVAGRPVLVRGNSQVLANGMGALNENGVINVKNKSHSITAQLVIPEVAFYAFALRDDRNVARTSSEKSCGCSQAAKCPPTSCFL